MVNFFDLFVVVATVGLAILGFREGLVRGAIKLAGFIAIVLIAAAFSHQIIDTAVLIPALPTEISVPLAFVIVLITGSLVVNLIAHLLHRIIHMTPVGFVDSGLGCAFGVVKAVLLNGLLALVISLSPPGNFLRSQYDSSLTAHHLANLISETVPFIKKSVIPYYQRLSPIPHEQEQKKQDGTTSQDFI